MGCGASSPTPMHLIGRWASSNDAGLHRLFDMQTRLSKYKSGKGVHIGITNEPGAVLDLDADGWAKYVVSSGNGQFVAYSGPVTEWKVNTGHAALGGQGCCPCCGGCGNFALENMKTETGEAWAPSLSAPPREFEFFGHLLVSSAL